MTPSLAVRSEALVSARRTILMVDDAPLLRELGALFLARAGRVLTAASGRITRQNPTRSSSMSRTGETTVRTRVYEGTNRTLRSARHPANRRSTVSSTAPFSSRPICSDSHRVKRSWAGMSPSQPQR